MIDQGTSTRHFLRAALCIMWTALSCCSPGILHAQVKFEKESRVRDSAVPAGAVRMIEALELEPRVRWYREESEKGISYEAKYRLHRAWHSIEFDSTGLFLDAEIEVKEKDMPERAREQVHAYLGTEFERYHIRKVQRQLTGPREEVLSALDSGSVPPQLMVRYEMIVKGRDERETHLYEFLFSQSGEPERKARIIQRNTDHLVY